MKKLLMFCLVTLLAACAIQRPLVLPEHDKYKHKQPTDAQAGTPANTSSPAALLPALPAITVAPPTTVAPTNAIEK